MNRNSNRPVIDIQRIPVGEKPLEELAAEVYGWLFQSKSTAKSSDGTFANRKKQHYNDSIKMISGGKEDDTAAYDDTYGIHMSKYLEGIEGTFSAEDLSVRVEELTKNLEGEMGYDDRQDNVKKSFADVGENLKDKFNNAPRKFSIATLKSMATGFADDVSAVRDAYKAQKDTRHQIDMVYSLP